jgi:hypothetical protein
MIDKTLDTRRCQIVHMKRNKVSAAYNHAKYLKQRTENDAVVG